MKKWTLIISLLAQNFSFVQAAEAASVCLTMEPQCFTSNFQTFKTLRPPGRPDLAFPTDPVRIIYTHRGNRSIFYRNSVLDKARVQLVFDFLKSARTRGVDLSDHMDYLQKFTKSSAPNITLEYMLTFLVFRQIDEIQLKTTGKFFEDFKALARIFDKNDAELKQILVQVAQGKSLVPKEVVNTPVKTPTRPPVAPTNPPVSTSPNNPPTNPPVKTPPVAPPVQTPTTPPTPPVAVEPVVEAPVRDIVGSSSAVYQVEPNTLDYVQFSTQLSPQLFVMSGNATSMALELRGVLRAAGNHGLNPDDYWNSELEELFNGGQVQDTNRFHESLTKGVLRLAFHLNMGRLVGAKVDPSFRYEQKSFKSMMALVAGLQQGGVGATRVLDSMAPSHVQYHQLRQALVKLKGLKGSSKNLSIKVNEANLSLGRKDAGIVALRQRLSDLGYTVTLGSDQYDEELDRALKNFNTMNTLSSKVNALTIGKLNVMIEKRIQQLGANLEKLRWLPVGAESKFIFINLGFSELKLFENGLTRMAFRTVNGRSLENDDKKTPSQTQVINFVLLNPTWTVPAGMAVRAKIPLIKRDMNWLDENNFKVADGFDDRRVWDPVTDRYVIKRIANYVDPEDVDWDRFKPNNNTPYWLVQQPGYNSTLGVVKFPLYEYGDRTKINPLDIYLHDSNERNLFANAKRLESSGCVRLQNPVELANELVQGHRGFDLERIRSFLPTQEQQESREEYQNMRVDLPKPVTVHMLYLSADVGDQGQIRFVEDEQVYKLDAKVLAAVKAAQ